MIKIEARNVLAFKRIAEHHHEDFEYIDGQYKMRTAGFGPRQNGFVTSNEFWELYRVHNETATWIALKHPDWIV